MAELFLPLFSGAAALSISDIKGAKGELVTAVLSVNNAPNSAGAFLLEVKYDFTTLSFRGFESGTLVENSYPLFNASNVEPGVVRIGGVDTVSPGITKSSSGTLVNLTFEVTGDKNSDLIIANLTDDMSEEGWSRRNGSFVNKTSPTDDGALSEGDGPENDVADFGDGAEEDAFDPDSRERFNPAERIDELLSKNKGGVGEKQLLVNTLMDNFNQQQKQTQKPDNPTILGEHNPRERRKQSQKKAGRNVLQSISRDSQISAGNQADNLAQARQIIFLQKQQQRVETILWLQLVCLVVQIIILLFLLMLLVNKLKEKTNQ